MVGLGPWSAAYSEPSHLLRSMREVITPVSDQSHHFDIVANISSLVDTVGLILWSSTELTLTILTATIPTLRPLYNSLRGVSSRGEYNDNSRGYELSDSAPMKLRPKEGNSMVTATAIGGNDNNSEEFILERGGNDIVCTETVTVEYGYKGAKSSSRSASRASPKDMA